MSEFSPSTSDVTNIQVASAVVFTSTGPSVDEFEIRRTQPNSGLSLIIGSAGNSNYPTTTAEFTFSIGNTNTAADAAAGRGNTLQTGNRGTIITVPSRTGGTSSTSNFNGLLLQMNTDSGLSSVEARDLYLALGRTATFITGNITAVRAVRIDAPTYAFNGASTISTAATVAIASAPTAGTNATITRNLAFWVQAGLAAFDGGLESATIQGGTTVSTTLTLKSTTGSGSSDAIIFQVGNNGATEALRLTTVGTLLTGGAADNGSTGSLTIRVSSANSVQNAFLIEQVNTGTSAGERILYQLYDSANSARTAAQISVQKSGAWTNGTANTFRTLMTFEILSGGEGSSPTEIMRFDASATARLLSFFGISPAVAKQASFSAGNITNNVTAGGTNGTIANYTDLSTYANDAAAIRNDIYQLAAIVKNINDGLRAYGLLT